MAKAVIPEMAKQHKGLIINIGSVVGEMYVRSYEDAMRRHSKAYQTNSVERYILFNQGCRIFS